MKTLLACIIALTLVCVWPQSAAAGDSAPAKAKPAAKSANAPKSDTNQKQEPAAKANETKASDDDSSPTDEDSGEGNAMDQAFGNDFIQHVKSEGPITYNETGALEIVGPATVEGKDMELSFMRLTGDENKKTMIATGSPVKIKQKDLRAECKRLVYNLETKKMTLEGNPVIWQRRKGKVTEISGDTIAIDRDKDGNTNVIIMPNKGAGKFSTLDMSSDADKGPSKAPAKPKEAKKVDTDQDKGMDAIKVPSLDFAF